MNVRIGSGFDVHAFDDTLHRPLVLAGVTVPDAPPLAGHSDADVAAHAVTDALLGALALGDLGTWFGVDRPEVADADSIGLLGVVVERLLSDGWDVGNLDLTIVAQRPRLGAFRDAMRARLARVLQVEPGVVSVKFSTTDRLGAVGRGEGIAAWASVLVTGD